MLRRSRASFQLPCERLVADGLAVCTDAPAGPVQFDREPYGLALSGAEGIDGGAELCTGQQASRAFQTHECKGGLFFLSWNGAEELAQEPASLHATPPPGGAVTPGRSVSPSRPSSSSISPGGR
jgi:hypothetical protein